MKAKKVGTKAFKFGKFQNSIGKDELRPAMMVACVKEGYIYTTDSHTLIRIALSEYTGVRIIDETTRNIYLSKDILVKCSSANSITFTDEKVIIDDMIEMKVHVDDNGCYYAWDKTFIPFIENTVLNTLDDRNFIGVHANTESTIDFDRLIQVIKTFPTNGAIKISHAGVSKNMFVVGQKGVSIDKVVGVLMGVI